jgi:DNA-binding transcriptional LysR family regulator
VTEKRRSSRAMKEVPSNFARLRDYEAFIAVVDAGSFTRAAARLGRSQHSISRSLIALEERVGVILIRRLVCTIQPTEAGLAFQRRLKEAFREIALAEAELSDIGPFHTRRQE